MQKKINQSYLEDFNKVILIQPLSKGYKVFQTLTRARASNLWSVEYSVNKECPYYICPFDGTFRKCKECDFFKEGRSCSLSPCLIRTAAVCNKINDCLAANLKVEFVEEI